MAQMKEQNRHPEKTLREIEMANQSDAELKILVIRTLRELLEYGKKIKEEMKVTLSEIKTNPQETNRGGKEAGFQTNHLEHKEGINIQPEQEEEKTIQKTKTKTKQNKEKNKDRLRNLWDTSKCADI